MKYYAVLVAAILVVAALGLYAYYDNLNSNKTVTGNHVYLGAVYYGPEKYTNAISAKVDFGKGANLNGSIYYVVLSIWDNNNSYDQIGISSLYGKFYCTYSYTEIVNGSIKYIFDPHWAQIVPGNHTLSLYVNNGDVIFKFDNNTFTAFTGGNNFIMGTYEKIGNHSFSGLTIYEEMYGFNNSFPGISFNFSELQYGTTGYAVGSITDWTPFSHNLTNFSSYVYMKSNIVNIYNSLPLTLKLSVQNLLTPASLVVANMNFTIPGSGQYSVNLLKGNYTVHLLYGGQDKTYKISLNTNMTYKITV
ncbi:MAG: hypothetical protein QXU18_00510 [Thermoplasmatales archaeon]